MNDNYFDEYPKLKNLYETMRDNRRDEILEHLINTDEKYATLVKNRAQQSMVLRSKLTEEGVTAFEEYMSNVYEQEIYELESMYAQAFQDALDTLKYLKMLH